MHFKILSENIDQGRLCLKCGFLEKKFKIASASGLHFQSPVCLWQLGALPPTLRIVIST